MTGMPLAIESASPTERLMNYCFTEYEPIAPTDGKLKSSNLLFQTFTNNNMSEKLFTLVQLIRTAFGESNSVWGTKWDGHELRWEFYFYDYRRRERQRSISLFIEAISSLADCSITINENLPYFMFSVDINSKLLADSGELNEIHLYMGNVASNVSSGICYSLTENSKHLENIYYFLDAQKHHDAIIAKICCSAIVDIAKQDVATILWPELARCRTICIANKQENDCIYFSGITVDQLVFFLNRLNYPAEIISYIGTNRADLDYMLYDVGFDYRMEKSELVIVKSGYYGVF
ncbi:MAG: hypothetical protein WC156_14130 [Pedobacter sp.]